MNPIKENQKIKIIPDKIKKISTGVIISVFQDCFVAEIDDISSVAPGMEPELLFSSEDYMVTCNSRVGKIEQNKVFFLFPQKFNYIQKREYPRINAKIPVLVKETETGDNRKAEIINIGGGGMQIAAPFKFNLHCILNTAFNLPNKKEINALFEILRISEEEAPKRNESFFLSGKFNSISNFDKTAIIQFCFKRRLELNCRNKAEV